MLFPVLSLLFIAMLCALAIVITGCTASEYGFNIGVGKVDITPKGAVTLAGSPFPEESTTVDIPLYVKAMVISVGEQKVAIVTLDTLKYPTELADLALQQVEKETGIPAGNVTITSSHTHSGPLYPYYNGGLTGSIVEAVKSALRDLTPCKIGISNTEVTGISHNRRLLIKGEAWNDWQVKSHTARYTFPAAGPIDPDLQVLAAVGKDGKYKAILWNYACHAAANSDNTISADYPGYVQNYIREQLRYDAMTLCLPGACGDINPNNSVANVGDALGDGIVKSLGNLEFIAKPSIYVDERIIQLPGRENPVFKEAEIAEKWPATLETYRNVFDAMMAAAKPTYKTYLCGIRIGDDFAMVTNPDELFDEFGLNIKKSSPFKHTMVVEQTNGALGYVPTKKDFEVGGYETWFGEHSFLSTGAGDTIQNESIDILKDLKSK